MKPVISKCLALPAYYLVLHLRCQNTFSSYLIVFFFFLQPTTPFSLNFRLSLQFLEQHAARLVPIGLSAGRGVRRVHQVSVRPLDQLRSHHGHQRKLGRLGKTYLSSLCFFRDYRVKQFGAWCEELTIAPKLNIFQGSNQI